VPLELRDQIPLQNDVLAIPSDRILLAPGKLRASGRIYHVARRVTAVKIGMQRVGIIESEHRRQEIGEVVGQIDA